MYVCMYLCMHIYVKNYTNPLASGGNLTTTFPISAPGSSMNLPCSLLLGSVDFSTCCFDDLFFLSSFFLFLLDTESVK